MAVKGLDNVLKNLKKFGEEAEDEIHIITGDNASQISLNAKNNAPVDLGKLRQSIDFFELGKGIFKVKANATNLAPYAAYIEFGTGRLVDVPTELKEIAIQFKGKGVKQINLQPQPYLYPAFVKGRENYLKDLKELLKNLTKKYS
jgi:HK97 gp10 family phage protein